ncbi:MAG: ABC transporter permease [Gemmatimonadota bacterium]
MNRLIQDLRYALRSLKKSPGFTAVAVLTLALGIGATTSIFSVVNAVLIRPLSYEKADRVLRVRGTFAETGDEFGTISLPNFRDLQEQTSGAGGSATVFEAMAAQHEWQPILLGSGEPERVNAASVTADWFTVLGVRPALGRFFLPEEDRPGASRSVVLGHGFWYRRLGADPAVLGRSLELEGEPYTVVGVAPAFDDLRLRLSQPEIWRVSPSYFAEMGRGGRSFMVIARLGPNVPLERAQAEVDAVTRRLEAVYPEPNAKRGAALVPIEDEIVGSVRPALLILLAAVGLVLLIACANVANLQFARTAGQRREIAVRSALGASRSRIVRHLLTESALLALIGGAAGLGLAWLGTDLLMAFGGAGLPRAEGIGVDGWVLAFAVGVSVLTGILFGIAPALLMSRTGLQPALKEGDAGRGLLRKTLVAGQVALAVVVLVGAGLLVRSLWNLTRVDPGLRPARILTLETQRPSSERFEEVATVAALYSKMLEGIGALPGVESAEAVDRLPMSGNFNGLGFTIEGRPEPAPGEMPNGEARAVTPGYFRTFGIPMLRGRGITPADESGGLPVVVINEAMARRYWPDGDPIGERIVRGDEGSWEIVGVVGDVRELHLSDAPVPAMYFPYAQAPEWMRLTSRFLIVRSESDPLALAPTIREAIRSVEPTMVIHDLRTMEGVIAGTVAQPRFRTLLLALFAAVAAVLGAVGIYGVVAHGVARRTRELAIRKALGARRDQIAGMVVRQGMVPVVAGLVIGAGGALALGRVLTSLLFGVGPADPLTFAAVAVLFLVAGMAASWLPARRATRVDPLVALRSE